jgi:hypothetical protein
LRHNGKQEGLKKGKTIRKTLPSAAIDPMNLPDRNSDESPFVLLLKITRQVWWLSFLLILMISIQITTIHHWHHTEEYAKNEPFVQEELSEILSRPKDNVIRDVTREELKLSETLSHPEDTMPGIVTREILSTPEDDTIPRNVTREELSETLSAPEDDRMPRNINIAFLGDSVTRFAYISLVYYLHTGKWIDPKWSREPCNPGEAISCPNDKWKIFNEKVSALMGEHEFCDCFRGEYDSRYFYDSERNNRVSFFMRGGHAPEVPFRGRVDSSRVWKNFTSRTGLPFGFKGGDPAWEHLEWHEMIREELGRMDPPPENLVLNAGLWRNKFQSSDVRKRVIDAAKDVGIKKVFWRTSKFCELDNVRNVDQLSERLAYLRSFPIASYQIEGFDKGNNVTRLKEGDQIADKVACQSFDCINISFTSRVHPDYLYDWRHFREPVNRLISEETLDVLGNLPSGYKRLDTNIISRPFDEAIL